MKTITWIIPKRVERACFRSGRVWILFVAITIITFLLGTTLGAALDYFGKVQGMHPLACGLIFSSMIAGVTISSSLILYLICPCRVITIDEGRIRNKFLGPAEVIPLDKICSYSIIPSQFMPETPSLSIRYLLKSGWKRSDTFALGEDITEEQIIEFMDSHGIARDQDSRRDGWEDSDPRSLLDILNRR